VKECVSSNFGHMWNLPVKIKWMHSDLNRTFPKINIEILSIELRHLISTEIYRPFPRLQRGQTSSACANLRKCLGKSLPNQQE
jgi:hypothetical protein